MFNAIVLHYEGSKPPPQVSTIRLWRVRCNVWVILAESPVDSLLFQPTLTGGILYSPYGKNSKVEITFEGPEDLQREFENCRIYEELNLHPNDGTSNKYFLCKCHVPDSKWSETSEKELVKIAQDFVWGGKWETTNPTSVWSGWTGNCN